MSARTVAITSPTPMSPATSWIGWFDRQPLISAFLNNAVRRRSDAERSPSGQERDAVVPRRSPWHRRTDVPAFRGHDGDPSALQGMFEECQPFGLTKHAQAVEDRPLLPGRPYPVDPADV